MSRGSESASAPCITSETRALLHDIALKSGGRQFVLRHYHRGGLAARFSRDQYFWRGEQETRPFAERQLTYRLHRAGLPVPAPLGARYQHDGMTYTGDIITERLNTVGSLAECLEALG